MTNEQDLESMLAALNKPVLLQVFDENRNEKILEEEVLSKRTSQTGNRNP